MDLSFSPEELAFRDEVRSWFEANLPTNQQKKVLDHRVRCNDDGVRRQH